MMIVNRKIRMALQVLVLATMAGCVCLVPEETAKAQGSHAPLRTIRQTAYAAGEHLYFNVGYGFITAGEAEFIIPSTQMTQGRECYKIVATVASTKTFSLFYKVDDRYEVVLDKDGIFPWHFSQHVREGKYSFDFEAQFDQWHNEATTQKGKFKTSPYALDVVSALFYVRTLDFSKMRLGEKIFLHNFYKDSTYLLAVRYLGLQRVKVAAGTFDCVCVEPLVQEGGMFKSNGRILVWLTNDERHIPVKVSTKVLIGSIDAELKAYSGINGPLRAKVENH